MDTTNDRRDAVTRQAVDNLLNEVRRLNNHIYHAAEALHADEPITVGRSSLVAITREGEKLIRRMRQREGRLFEKTTYGASARQLEAAAQTLRDVRQALTVKEISQ